MAHVFQTYATTLPLRSAVRKTMFLIALLVLGTTQQVWASPDVNPDDPVAGIPYTVSESLEIIRGTGCFPMYLDGDAIKTQRAIAKLLVDARDCIARLSINKPRKSMFAYNIWKHMIKQFHYEYSLEEEGGKNRWDKLHITRPRMRVQALAFEDDQRPIPFPGITAITSPWTAYREGIDYNSGTNTVLSFDGALSLGEWFDVSLEPMLVVHIDNQAGTIHFGNMKFTVSNFEIKLGRSPIYWGQGRHGRVLFAGNAQPMDLIQIGNPYSIDVPYLGFFNYRVFLGILGKDRAIERPFILGARIMFKPTSWFELGFSRALMFGGNGSPNYKPWDPILELFGIRTEGFIFHIPVTSGARSTSGIANNVFSLDFRFRIPPLRSTEFFIELFSEDGYWGGDWLTQEGCVHAGIWIPRLNRSGDWQLLLEGTYIADITYTHSIFSSGWTNRKRIMGNDIGPDSIEFYLWTAKRITPTTKLWGSFAYQEHGLPSASYVPTIPNPENEQRFLIQAGATHALDDHLTLDWGIGAQRIENDNFNPGSRKTSMMGELQLDFQF